MKYKYLFFFFLFYGCGIFFNVPSYQGNYKMNKVGFVDKNKDKTIDTLKPNQEGFVLINVENNEVEIKDNRNKFSRIFFVNKPIKDDKKYLIRVKSLEKSENNNENSTTDNININCTDTNITDIKGVQNIYLPLTAGNTLKKRNLQFEIQIIANNEIIETKETNIFTKGSIIKPNITILNPDFYSLSKLKNAQKELEIRLVIRVEVNSKSPAENIFIEIVPIKESIKITSNTNVYLEKLAHEQHAFIIDSFTFKINYFNSDVCSFNINVKDKSTNELFCSRKIDIYKNSILNK